MKITVWLREREDGSQYCRSDVKYESRDTVRMQRHGRRILEALEGGAEPTEAELRKAARAKTISDAVNVAANIDLSNLPDMNLKNVGGSLYSIGADVWQRMSVLLDCVNAVKGIQKAVRGQARTS